MFDFVKSLVLDYKDELVSLVWFFLIFGYTLLGIIGGFSLFMTYIESNKTKEDKDVVVHACGFFVLCPLFLLAFLFKATIIGISDLVDYIFNVFKSLIFEDEMDGDKSDYSLRHTSKD